MEGEHEEAQQEGASFQSVLVSDAFAPLQEEVVIRNVAPLREVNQIKIEDKDPIKLAQLNYDVLTDIFRNFNARTLLTMMKLSENLEEVALASRHWRNINLCGNPLPLKMIAEALKQSHAKTHSIRVHGPLVALRQFEFKQFTRILVDSLDHCMDLSVLELEGVAIDLRVVNMTIFPQSLRRLTIDCCNVCALDTDAPILFGMDTQLINLEELAIQNNNWLQPENVAILSKLPKLRWLSLKNCQNIVAIPNFLTIWSGFKKLEYLNLCLTPVHELDMGCFNVAKTLKELHLEYLPQPLDWTTLEVPEYYYDTVDGTCYGAITDEYFCRFGIEEIDDIRPVVNHFERLTVRGYGLISDVTLEHLMEFSPNLKFVDLSGTDVTRDGVLCFHELRPDCKIVVEHLSAVASMWTSTIEDDTISID